MDQVYSELLRNESLYPAVKHCPVFLEDESSELGHFIEKSIKKPSSDILKSIDHSKIRPSPQLADLLYDSLNGNDFFSYSDDQADAVSSIVQLVIDSVKYGEKRTVIIRGRPGTGKSIVALNAMGQLIKKKDNEGYQLNVCYFTANKAPRLYYADKLVENDVKKKDIESLFKHPVALKRNHLNEYHCSFFDEAHRLFEWAGGIGLTKNENLLKSCIVSSKVSVFFIDEDQAVTVRDKATIDLIKRTAEECSSKVILGPSLSTQFRVLGGEDYIEFIRDLLGYSDVRPYVFSYDSRDYTVHVYDSASHMREDLRRMNDLYGTSRMVSGYTYEWITKDNYNIGYDIILDNGDFKARWNLNEEKYSWLYDKDSFEDVGCIHTCQGLDMQYCGVIIGKDLRYEDGKLIFDQSKIALSDRSSGIRTCKDRNKAESLIRNTYNVLLTRGMRGTFIYCEDEGLREHIKDMLGQHD